MKWLFNRNKSNLKYYPTTQDIGAILEKYIGKNNVHTIFDIGAHHGKFALSIIGLFPKATVYAFEPYKNSFDVLVKNTKDKKIIPLPLAVCNYEGNATLNINSFEETNSLLDSSITGNNVIDNLTKSISQAIIETTTIDAIIENYKIKNIDLLKLDIQGSELSALQGAENLLSNQRVAFILAEVEFIEIYKNQPLYHNVADFLVTKGYSLYSIYNIHYDINDRISWADAVFISSTIKL